MAAITPPTRLARLNRWSLITGTIALLIAGGVIGWLALPQLRDRFTTSPSTAEAEHDHDHDHDSHDHDHGDHGDHNDLPGVVVERDGDGHGHSHDHSDVLELSEQAKKNIGLKTGPVRFGEFVRTIAIPGIVEERPGRSTIHVTSPITGVVTKIYATRGNAVQAGDVLFDVRVTHEELVQAQSDLLRTVEELDVIGQEVRRLETAATNAIAGKNLLERKYEQQKAQASLRAQSQTLILHGLSEEQVAGILKTRTLLHSFQVKVPEQEEASAENTVYQVQTLNVERGAHVTAGDALLTLADHAELFIAGSGFERDMSDIQRAIDNKWTATAIFDAEASQSERIEALSIVTLDNHIDPASRTIHAYVSLSNSVLRDARGADGVRTLQWRFKPGQRLQLQIPVEVWTKRIVLPLEAIAQDGADWFVFKPDGGHIDRRAVHVEFRDQHHAVIANDGSIKDGEVICLTGAHQMLLALKNKMGGGVDPHAGHNH